MSQAGREADASECEVCYHLNAVEVVEVMSKVARFPRLPLRLLLPSPSSGRFTIFGHVLPRGSKAALWSFEQQVHVGQSLSSVERRFSSAVVMRVSGSARRSVDSTEVMSRQKSPQRQVSSGHAEKRRDAARRTSAPLRCHSQVRKLEDLVKQADKGDIQKRALRNELAVWQREITSSGANHDFLPVDLTVMFRHLRKAGVELSPEFLDWWTARALGLMNSFEPRHLAETIYCLGCLGVPYPRLEGFCEKWFVEVVGKMRGFDAYGLSNTMVGIVKIGIPMDALPASFVDAWCEHAVGNFPSFTDQGFGNSIHGWAKIGSKLSDLPHDFLIRWFEAVQRRGEFLDTQALANLVCAFVAAELRIDDIPVSFVNFWCCEAATQMQKFNAQDLTESIWAWSKLAGSCITEFPHGFLSRWYEAAAVKSASFNAQDLSKSVYALAFAGLKIDDIPVSFVDSWCCRAVDTIDVFEAQSVANSIWAWAKLGSSLISLPHDFLQLWIRGVVNLHNVNASSFSSQNVSNMFYAVALASIPLEILPNDFIIALRDMCVKNFQSNPDVYVPQELLQIIRAVAILKIPPATLGDDFFRLWCKSASEKVDSFSDNNFSPMLLAFAMMNRFPEFRTHPSIQEFLNHVIPIVQVRLSSFDAQGVANSTLALAILCPRLPQSNSKHFDVSKWRTAIHATSASSHPLGKQQIGRAEQIWKIRLLDVGSSACPLVDECDSPSFSVAARDAKNRATPHDLTFSEDATLEGDDIAEDFSVSDDSLAILLAAAKQPRTQAEAMAMPASDPNQQQPRARRRSGDHSETAVFPSSISPAPVRASRTQGARNPSQNAFIPRTNNNERFQETASVQTQPRSGGERLSGPVVARVANFGGFSRRHERLVSRRF